MYNRWFMEFAPSAYRETRITTTLNVESTLRITNNLTDVSTSLLKSNPEVLPILRMSTCPPLAVDRLVGLAGVSKNTVVAMEAGKLPGRMPDTSLDEELSRIGTIIRKMTDPDIFVWLQRDMPASKREIHRAATIIADRLCGAVANPIIRNAQEKRQLGAIAAWLEASGYKRAASGGHYKSMEPGTYSFHMNIPVMLEGGLKSINIPVDAVVMPFASSAGDMPLLIEAKSAGDFINVNKRRKEEVMKMTHLRKNFGQSLRYILFLSGYFDSGYLGYGAAEGIDWVWEHRIDDLAGFGI